MAIIFYPLLSVERLLKFSLVRKEKERGPKTERDAGDAFQRHERDDELFRNDDKIRPKKKKKKRKKEAPLTSAWCREGAEQSGPLMPERL